MLTKPEANIGRFVFPFVPDRAYGNPNRGIITVFMQPLKILVHKEHANFTMRLCIFRHYLQ